MISRLRDLSGWKLEDSSKDIRGWPLKDETGRELGTVDDMIVDTDTRHVETVVLHSGAELPVSALHIGNREVLISREYAGQFAGGGGMLQHGATRTERPMGTGHGEIRIPVIEEHVEVGKRRVETPGTTVHTGTSQRPVEKEVTLREETVNVERRPANRPATDEDIRRAEQAKDVEFKSVHEEPVVRKSAEVVEEVVIGKDVKERKEKIRETERRTDVDVNKDKTITDRERRR